MTMTSCATITLDDWEQVAEYVDAHNMLKPSQVSEIITSGLPTDALTLGQLASKAWLLDGIMNIGVPPDVTWAILGSWIGMPVSSFIEHFHPRRVYGIDVDPRCAQWSEHLNQKWVQSGWRYKAVTHDVDLLDCSDMSFVTGGEAIDVKPEVIVNTSAEHMSSDWFHTLDSDQLVIIQSNDNPDLDGHINTCSSLEVMMSQYPLSEYLIAASLTVPGYTRYMIAGYPA